MKHIDDAARLAAVLFAMKRWEWCMPGQPSMRIPNEEDIAKTLREFLTSMSTHRCDRHSSGRLHVEWNADFNQFEFLLEIGRISPGELWDEERIDHFVQLDED